MRIGSEAPRRRAHSLPRHWKPWSRCGSPPPRMVLALHHIGAINAEPCVCCCWLLPSLSPSLRRAQDDALRHLAEGYITPQRNQQLACQRDDHCLADIASGALGPFAEPFWNISQRHASWTRPRRTRALPPLARPFSRRLFPLSSGAPVTPA